MFSLVELSSYQWFIAVLGAIFIGMGKGGIPGVGNITIALYAMIFPAHQSVGILLPVLICADIVAVRIYRQYTLWPYIWKLLPWVIVGIIAAWGTLRFFSDQQLTIFIGVILLLMTGLHFLRQAISQKAAKGHDPLPHSKWFISTTGIIGGFATMAANAAGPIAALYFLAARLPKFAFIGTMAWFFLIVNFIKLPLQAQLNMVTAQTIQLSLILGLISGVSVLMARYIVKFIPQKTFEALVWFFIIVAGIRLITMTAS